MTTAETHVGKLEAQLSHLGAKLDELAAKFECGSAEVKADCRNGIDDLKAQHVAAQVKLEELKNASKGKWSHFRTGMARAWNEVEGAFRSPHH
jgi:hypothetical protein